MIPKQDLQKDSLAVIKCKVISTFKATTEHLNGVSKHGSLLATFMTFLR